MAMEVTYSSSVHLYTTIMGDLLLFVGGLYWWGSYTYTYISETIV